MRRQVRRRLKTAWYRRGSTAAYLALVVSLVVILGGPETARRGDLRHDVVAFAPQLGDEPLGRRLLGGRGVEYLGTVLVAEVGALPVFLGRVVDFEDRRASVS